MATQVNFHSFKEALAEKAHNLGSDQLKIALSNTAPNAATNTQLSDISEISYTNLSAREVTTTSSSQTSNTYSLVLQDLVLTASGNVANFRYVILYNDTSAGDLLISYVDYGSTVSMVDTDTFTIDFPASTITF